MLTLEFPSEKHREMYQELIQEWGAFEEIPTSPGKLFAGENFDEFLKTVIQDTTNNQKGVNSHLYFLIGNENILGALHIRHNLGSPNLIEGGGHIGYGIAPKYRRQGYATQMLSLGLKEAKKLGLKKVLITCCIDNIGSSKVILKNGGVFERNTKDGLKKRYWIDIK